MKKVINVNIAVEIEEEVLQHMLKTSKLEACRKVVERIPELRSALSKIIEKKFFSSGVRSAVDETFAEGFSSTKGTDKE